jgi:PQQ-dependent catabolism-associated CXXCW motif protein
VRAEVAALVIAAFAVAAPSHAQEKPPEPGGYRNENYRTAVPATLAGARVLTTTEAETIWRAKTGVFIDVLPRPPKPQNLPAGTVWRDKPRLNIPGSIWLPDTGYGKLAEATEDYLRQGVARASGGNNAALLVIYCQADCWMSWNAAKRIRSYGYSNVAWYPDGTDGWERADLPLAESQPESRAGEATSLPRWPRPSAIRSPAGSYGPAQTAFGRSR